MDEREHSSALDSGASTVDAATGQPSRARGISIGILGLAGYVLGVQGVILLMRLLTFGGDSPELGSSSTLRALALDSVWLALFLLHHHMAATLRVKRWLERELCEVVERSLYVGVSGLLLIGLLSSWRPLPGTLWDLRGSLLAVPLWLLYAMGWSCAIGAVLMLNQFRLFGLLGAWRRFRRQPHAPAQLVTRGPYRYLRHPMYLGFIIACWATPHMDVARAYLALCLTVYALLGSRFEERKLISRYGEGYLSYRARVPAWIPRLHSEAAPNAPRPGLDRSH